jgi:hypothetical protein
MSIVFPTVVSSTDDLNSYTNFIEYVVFTEDEMPFSDFNLSEKGLKIEDIVQELNRRLNLYGNFKPYVVLRRKVKSNLSKKENHLHYVYCLYYAIKGGNSNTAETNIFETITNVCLKNYFNTEDSLITSVGQSSSNLKGAIDTIRMALKEAIGNYDELSVHAKDGGIDIVTFKPMDRRGNQVICLTDATIGKNWISQKKVRSKLSYWSHYIHFKVTPITCLSVVHIVDESDFYKASNENGLIFDRARIMNNYKNDASITFDLTNWIRTL